MQPHRVLVVAATAALVAATGVLLAPSAQAGPTTYQAESAALSGGAVVATDHSGYTGTGFVAGYTDGNKGNAATTFTVAASAAGGYQLALRYANATTATMTLSLYVNGTRTGQIPLPATANWDTWATRTDTVTLPAGTNTVAYRFDGTDSGNVNLDSLTVTDIPPPPAGTYEAESAALSGGAVLATDHSGYTGTGFVAGYTDGNKGGAATTFGVAASAAGAYRLALRYANGTTATMTLSLHVNGARIGQIPLPATANWDTWATRADTVTLPAGTNTVAYRFDGTDSGNVNLDSLTVTYLQPAPPGTYEFETGFLSGGATVAAATGGYTGTGYATGFTAAGARAIRTVNLPAAATAAVTLRYSNGTGATRTLSTYINGLRTGQVSLPAGAGWLTASQNLALRAGLNLIGFQYDPGDTGDVALDNVTVAGASALAARGASVAYTGYGAESGGTNAAVIGPDRAFGTFASEASGRRAVRLSTTGQYVEITLTRPANSVVVRYVVPDNAAGTGGTWPLALYAGGAKVQDLSLSSTYSWVYGTYPYTNDPAQGSPHHFFDEVRARFATTWPAGTVLRLQKDSSSNAPYYVIDLIEAEQVAAAYPMPANYLSITSYGAVANDTADDTAAVNNAVAAAVSQGRGVWIPAGTFVLTARVNVAGVAVRGAGPWYSVLRGTNGKGGFFATGGTVQIADLTVAGDVRYRDDTNFDTAIEGNFGTGSLVYDVWLEHAKVGMWIDSGTNGLYAVGVRIRNTFADGVNLRADVRNTRVDQSVVRNTGDDALAMFSAGTAVTNCAYTFNTVQTPLEANGIGIYGGTTNAAEDNLIFDTVTASSGIAVSTRFGIAFSGPISVRRNTITRAGGFERNWGAQLGALWIYADRSDITTPVLVTEVSIVDSTYQAILFSFQKTITNVTLDHVAVTGAGTYGIELNAAGSAYVTYVTVTGAASGGLNNLSGYTLNRGPGNSGF